MASLNPRTSQSTLWYWGFKGEGGRGGLTEPPMQDFIDFFDFFPWLLLVCLSRAGSNFLAGAFFLKTFDDLLVFFVGPFHWFLETRGAM